MDLQKKNWNFSTKDKLIINFKTGKTQKTKQQRFWPINQIFSYLFEETCIKIHKKRFAKPHDISKMFQFIFTFKQNVQNCNFVSNKCILLRQISFLNCVVMVRTL